MANPHVADALLSELSDADAARAGAILDDAAGGEDAVGLLIAKVATRIDLEFAAAHCNDAGFVNIMRGMLLVGAWLGFRAHDEIAAPLRALRAEFPAEEGESNEDLQAFA